MPNQPNKKIIFLSLSGIGNFLMQSSTIHAVKSAYPDWHITAWVAPRGTKILAKANPDIDKVIKLPIKCSLLKHFKNIRRLSGENFDTGAVLSPGQLLKSAAYLYFTGIPKRVGHQYPLFNNPQNSLLLTHSIPEEDNLHDIEQNLNLLKLLNIKPPPDSAAAYKFHIPNYNQRKAEKLLARLNIPNSKHIIGFHPESALNFPWKRWPSENFIKVGRHLSRKNCHILLFGNNKEKTLLQKIKRGVGGSSSIIQTDLLTAAGVINKCSLFLSNDSGLMHLAAAAGTTTYGLFGPTDENKTGPRGASARVIRAPGTSPVYITEKKQDLGNSPHSTMQAITPKLVLETIKNTPAI